MLQSNGHVHVIKAIYMQKILFFFFCDEATDKRGRGLAWPANLLFIKPQAVFRPSAH